MNTSWQVLLAILTFQTIVVLFLKEIHLSLYIGGSKLPRQGPVLPLQALWTRNTHSDPPMFGKIRVQELPHNKGIYFLEFSPNSNFNYVKLCALESAARLNPQHPVFLLLHSTRTDLRSLPSFLRQLDNLHVHKVDFDAMILESPFAEVFPEISENLIEYYSDIIRMLILYHKGGAYFDLDAIQIRPVPFDKVPNSIPLLSQQTRVIQNSVLLFQAGNPFLAAALDRIPTCVHLSHWGPCGLRLLEYLLLVKCTLVGAKTSSERFICPPSYQVQIFSHSDLFVLDTTRALDALGNLSFRHLPNLFAIHTAINPHTAMETKQGMSKFPALVQRVMKKSCPGSVHYMDQDLGERSNWS